MTKPERYELEQSIVSLVRALCADYERQRRLLKQKNLDDMTKVTLITFSYTVYTEVARATHLVGVYVDTFIREIAMNVGYDHSELCHVLTRGKYYRSKRRAIWEIAHALNLVVDTKG